MLTRRDVSDNRKKSDCKEHVQIGPAEIIVDGARWLFRTSPQPTQFHAQPPRPLMLPDLGLPRNFVLATRCELARRAEGNLGQFEGQRYG